MRHGIVNVLASLTFAVAGSWADDMMPSWVVNWSDFSSEHSISPWRNNHKFAAGGVVDPDIPYTFDGNRLGLQGLVVDMIVAVSEAFTPRQVVRRSWMESARRLIREHRRNSGLSEDDIESDLGGLLILDGQSSLYELTSSVETKTQSAFRSSGMILTGSIGSTVDLPSPAIIGTAGDPRHEQIILS
ncbi:hypothetical protein EJ03DRAFT_111594 [Teratosphaeria nubilosa]|uniref:Uncharacterized protein n=1 Tax=Teratosphaeria nubilosa TaxID=161662 RepID=A0A6G1L7G7_9PEZI|nr:hypothetical protein EJ03DRAFT_111594 [Teratosphaeria nubilosa]